MRRSALLICFLALLGAAACSRPLTSVGLRPEYPALLRAYWAQSVPRVIEVDSLQPTFRWAPFPNAEEYDESVRTKLARAENVRYDLRVWRGSLWLPFPLIPSKQWGLHYGERVYERQGLREPWHRIEEPLQPTTLYVWSVRARFELDGETRATEWGRIVDRHEISGTPYFPFKTPAGQPHRLGESGHMNPDPRWFHEGRLFEVAKPSPASAQNRPALGAM